MRLDLQTLVIALILTVLAGGSWWLARMTTETTTVFDGKQRHDPDFIIENFHATIMDNIGKPHIEMQAVKLVHYGDDGSSIMEQPYIIQHEPKRAPTHARAKEGFLPQSLDYIQLSGDVHLAQGRDVRSAGGDIRAQQLTFQFDKTRR